VRLDRYLSQGLGTPRKHSLSMVRSGQVTVNGEVVRDAGVQVVLGRDAVTYREQTVPAPGHTLLMLHKPVGYVTTTEEGATPIVMDLIPIELKRRDLSPIGRLDKDTTGLLLLTTDGGLNHALTHPRRHVEKAYVAELDGELGPEAEAQFLEGVVLSDGTVCKPGTLERLGERKVRIVLKEGRFHQVKRMVAALGATVLTLHRERIGELWLPADLAPGEVRGVTEAEMTLLGIDLPCDSKP
jgi:16S rRNA pseudouridine516 synthase